MAEISMELRKYTYDVAHHYSLLRDGYAYIMRDKESIKRGDIILDFGFAFKKRRNYFDGSMKAGSEYSFNKIYIIKQQKLCYIKTTSTRNYFTEV